LRIVRKGLWHNVFMERERVNQRVTFVTRLSQIQAIDEWRRRQPDLPNKNEAIRRLIDLALQVETKGRP
jgi:hypothetical protein